MSDFDEKLIERLKRLEREVERLQVKERPDKTGWIPVSDTWTYASATTINVPSGATSIYSVGMGIRLTANSVVKQAYIVKVENTLLTVAGDALTNHTFSAISYTPTPQTALGFPVWFSWTPNIIALTVVGTPTYTGRFSVAGRIATIQISVSATTSTESTAGTSQCNNLPIYGRPSSALTSNSGAQGYMSSLIDAPTVKLYFPPWEASAFTFYTWGSYEI